jgi:CRISPR/Cas system-associated exonuclease Cas4 (RecB family)
LIIGDRQGQIGRLENPSSAIKSALLHQDWQTKLYLYLLQVTTNFPPENLSMTYWFANSPQDSVIINYNQNWHDQIHRELLEIITEITQETEYPTLYPDSKICQSCEFRYRCFEQSAPLITVDNIPEISI